MNVFGSLTSPSEKRFSCTCTATGRSTFALEYAGVRNTIAYYNDTQILHTIHNDTVHCTVIMHASFISFVILKNLGMLCCRPFFGVSDICRRPLVARRAKHQQIITSNKPTPSFYTFRMPFLSHHQQFQSTEGYCS